MGPGPLVLVLGGTTEARRLVPLLLREPQVRVVTSLAGRTRNPSPPAGGALRVGGFGGPDGLTEHLRDAGVQVLVDATHPFAATMPHHAAAACAAAGVPRLRLLRPGWQEVAGDRWHRVADLDAAAAAVGDIGATRVLLTTGRQHLQPFAAVPDTWFLVRAIEAPDPQPIPAAEVRLDRGPFTVAGERSLIDRHGIDLVVTKDSGGTATAPKLAVARERSIPVVVVDRPTQPAGPRAPTAEAAAAWVSRLLAAA